MRRHLLTDTGIGISWCEICGALQRWKGYRLLWDKPILLSFLKDKHATVDLSCKVTRVRNRANS